MFQFSLEVTTDDMRFFLILSKRDVSYFDFCSSGELTGLYAKILPAYRALLTVLRVPAGEG